MRLNVIANTLLLIGALLFSIPIIISAGVGLWAGFIEFCSMLYGRLGATALSGLGVVVVAILIYIFLVPNEVINITETKENN